MAGPDASPPGLDAVLADPSVSRACKAVLRAWLGRDPVDAANDAELLAAVLGRRCDQLLRRPA